MFQKLWAVREMNKKCLNDLSIFGRVLSADPFVQEAHVPEAVGMGSA